MHPSVLEWFEAALTREDVSGKSVLEVGACDVNGSVRPYVESLKPSRYLGVDASDGPRVDQIVNCEDLVNSVGNGWDIVISTEMLEHVQHWRVCMTQLAKAIKPGGLLLLTTRSPGFPYHPYPDDFWRFTPTLMLDVLSALDLEGDVIDDTDPRSPGVFVFARKPEGDWLPYLDVLPSLYAAEAVK